jgi:hypothetical protein
VWKKLSRIGLQLAKQGVLRTRPFFARDRAPDIACAINTDNSSGHVCVSQSYASPLKTMVNSDGWYGGAQQSVERDQ